MPSKAFDVVLLPSSRSTELLVAKSAELSGDAAVRLGILDRLPHVSLYMATMPEELVSDLGRQLPVLASIILVRRLRILSIHSSPLPLARDWCSLLLSGHASLDDVRDRLRDMFLDFPVLRANRDMFFGSSEVDDVTL